MIFNDFNDVMFDFSMDVFSTRTYSQTTTGIVMERFFWRQPWPCGQQHGQRLSWLSGWL